VRILKQNTVLWIVRTLNLKNVEGEREKMTTQETAVEQTREYYDDPSADNFYRTIWGPEHIHVGLYYQDEGEGESISEASVNTVVKIASLLPHRGSGTFVLDIGSGYGGSARFLAKEKLFRVDCLNLSSVQNERNRRTTEAAGLQDRISIHEGNFEEMPFLDSRYDVVWSQDALIHSARKNKVLQEVNRVLKPGGDFVFTDLMQSESCPAETVALLMQRFHPGATSSPDAQYIGSFTYYRQLAEKMGWQVKEILDLSFCAKIHYQRVLADLERCYDELLQSGDCSQAYMDHMIEGLYHWVAIAEQSHLQWGILHFQKPATT